MISLYVHVPFCLRKCYYCDFVSKVPSEGDISEYTETVCLEIKRQADLFMHPKIHTIYFGGGTPTILPAAVMEKLISCIMGSFSIDCDAEISLEMNPGTADAEKLRILRQLGFNRLSMGVQSFDDQLLMSIGRMHTSCEADRAFDLARHSGFENINIDLMYALPGQSLKQWETTLQRAVELSPEHLSCYSLILEENTPMTQMILSGERKKVLEEEEARMEQILQEAIKLSGYERYEVSNYTKNGKECRHNITYWECFPYLGVGPSAHSDMNGRFFNRSKIGNWKEDVLNGTINKEEKNRIDDRRFERMMMGLRMLKGVDLERFQQDFHGLPHVFWPDSLGNFYKANLLKTGAKRMYLTEEGLKVMNTLLVDMLLEEEKKQNAF